MSGDAMNGILFYSTFLLFLKGFFWPAHFLSSSLFTITRSFFLIPPTYIIRSLICRIPPSPTLLSLWSCPLHRLPLTTTCGFLRIAPRTSLVFTHTLAPTHPCTKNGLWYACPRLSCPLHAQQPQPDCSGLSFS